MAVAMQAIVAALFPEAEVVKGSSREASWTREPLVPHVSAHFDQNGERPDFAHFGETRMVVKWSNPLAEGKSAKSGASQDDTWGNQ